MSNPDVQSVVALANPAAQGDTDWRREQKRIRNRDWQRIYRARHREKTRNDAKVRYRRNKRHVIENIANKRTVLRREIINSLGAFCVCCGEADFLFLTIDHINNDGGAHRKQLKNFWIYDDIKKQGIPRDKYQVLCMNCNWAKRYTNECPHKTKTKEFIRLRASERLS